jgi:hypothetical protein
VLTVKKHNDKDIVISSQQEASAKLGPVTGGLAPGANLASAVLENARFDSRRHLPKTNSIQSICKEYKKGSLFRCTHCHVALHAEYFCNGQLDFETCSDNYFGQKRIMVKFLHEMLGFYSYFAML